MPAATEQLKALRATYEQHMSELEASAATLDAATKGKPVCAPVTYDLVWIIAAKA